MQKKENYGRETKIQTCPPVKPYYTFTGKIFIFSQKRFYHRKQAKKEKQAGSSQGNIINFHKKLLSLILKKQRNTV